MIEVFDDGKGMDPDMLRNKALAKGLNDSEPLVWGAAAWALGQCGTTSAVERLTARGAVEQDVDVRAEIQRALAVATGPQPSAPGVSDASGSAGGCCPGKSSQ